MQSKIAHKAERAAFGLALDQIIKAASGPDREKNLDKLLDMAGNLLKDTAPGAVLMGSPALDRRAFAKERMLVKQLESLTQQVKELVRKSQQQ